MKQQSHWWLPAFLICAVFPHQAGRAHQGSVQEHMPATLNPSARYVICLHGRIIEDQGRRPTHDTSGVYEYQQILEQLAAGGLVVVSEQQAPMTDMDAFAGHVADQVRHLLKAGVPPSQVSVVGGGIAIRASAEAGRIR